MILESIFSSFSDQLFPLQIRTRLVLSARWFFFHNLAGHLGSCALPQPPIGLLARLSSWFLVQVSPHLFQKPFAHVPPRWWSHSFPWPDTFLTRYLEVDGEPVKKIFSLRKFSPPSLIVEPQVFPSFLAYSPLRHFFFFFHIFTSVNILVLHQ